MPAWDEPLGAAPTGLAGDGPRPANRFVSWDRITTNGGEGGAHGKRTLELCFLGLGINPAAELLM